MELLSPRVNSARLPAFMGRTVRLPCKVLKFQGASVIVEACDGGQVEVRLNPRAHRDLCRNHRSSRRGVCYQVSLWDQPRLGQGVGHEAGERCRRTNVRSTVQKDVPSVNCNKLSLFPVLCHAGHYAVLYRIECKIEVHWWHRR
ncbi:hypothetical protein EV401DRAFT_988020 [Pisolithus croceorrhizus]|nr:hypothetical protein EV401DRAFT_988020 [Pisolithus croceorrhizus]